MISNLAASDLLKAAVGLRSEPVGVKFVNDHEQPGFTEVHDHRYCQTMMRARSGESLLLSADGISCPAAAAALGFKPLSHNLQDGSMLQGYGIFQDSAAAVRVMETMPRLEPGLYKAVAVQPLSKWQEDVDVVVVEDEVEKLMWIALAYLNDGGGRLEFSTSVLQAVCVDATVLPFLSRRLNMSFGCYGCRDATDARPEEAILGFPGDKLAMVTANLKYLASKAIARSRAKHICELFTQRIEKENKTELAN
jgi:uncharacterized protein (DUF169 family)